MSKMIMMAAGLLLVSSGFLAAPAEARIFRQVVSVQGAGGHGYFRARTVNRHENGVSVRRNFQTNSGAGMVTNRRASWGDGVYTGNATHTFNNGASFGRATTVTGNGNGTANYITTRTGLDGHSVTRSGTISR